MTIIPIYRPYIFLRCRKCGKKTDHVLISTAATEKGDVEETFECQQCGEKKKIYELDSLMGRENLAIQELDEKIESKRAIVERLEFKKRDQERKLRELQKGEEEEPAKDYAEAKTSEAPVDSQQQKRPEEQPRSIKIKKKKRKWF